MTCGFCGNDVSAERAFIGVEDSAGRPDCICCDCVLDLYVVMTASAMRPLRPPRDPTHAFSRLGQVIRLRPPKAT
jgi:hypothetical protein